MKTSVILLVMLCASILAQAQTNVYYPLPTSNTYWRVSTGGFDCGFCQDYQDVISGDTVIYGKIHQKIQRSGVTYSTDFYGNCTQIIAWEYNYYVGAFRNDSINEKVYFIPASASSDTLLYDFNLNIQDTLPQSYIFDPAITGISVISQVDSIVIGTKYHKRFGISVLDFQNYDYLIEGIGASTGLLERIYPFWECGSWLDCVEENGMTVYPDTGLGCNLVIVNTDLLNKPIYFKIVPNPVYNFAKVNFLPSYNSIDLSLTDVLGVERLRIENLKNESRIDLTNFKEGLYFYKVIQGSSVISTGKLIKYN
jgi:hypothetical protein